MLSRDVWPTYRYRDGALFRDDYIADYYLAFNPKGFTQAYRLGVAWLDPRTISRLLPYALLLATLGFVGVSAWGLGGPIAAWAAMALCLSSDLFLGRMMGGLPRAFGLPLLAMAGAALVLRRPGLLIAATLLGAAFYYPAAMLGGMALAAFLLLPERYGGLQPAWTWQRRVAILGASGAATVLVALLPRAPIADTAMWRVAVAAALAALVYGTLNLLIVSAIVRAVYGRHQLRPWSHLGSIALP